MIKHMIKRRIFLILALFLAVFLIVDISLETNFPLLAVVELQTPKFAKDDSLKILQISDLHNKSFGRDESRLLEIAGRAKPDMIAFTGDLADRLTTDFTNIFRLVASLKTLTPSIYYVPGNHDQPGPVMNGLFEGLASMGVVILTDTAAAFEKGGMRVNICGINYPFRQTSRHSGPAAEREALERALKGVDTREYTVLLSHSPRIVENIDGRPFDLILSGHTHGGQVRLPVIGSVLRLDREMFGEYDKGLFELANGSELYVDSGLGTSIVPVRFCDRAQITLITVAGTGRGY